jgi:zinc protease
VQGQDIVAKLDAVLGKWPVGSVTQPQLPAVEQVKKRQIYLVDKPGAAQSEVRIGRIGVQRLTDDYFPLTVMNTILGGMFTSRLNANLREDKGYTYGAGSYFDFRPTPGPFLAYASVQTDVTDKALVEFMKEIKGILKPVPEEELNKAKNYIALGFPADFQSVAQLNGQLANLQMYGLPGDYLNNYIPKILSVSKSDVQRVAKKYLDPDKVAIIIVGDRAKIEKGIADLNLAPIQHSTIEEVLGPMPKVDGE